MVVVTHSDGALIGQRTFEMKRLSTGDFIRQFSAYSDNALSSPIVVTKRKS